MVSYPNTLGLCGYIYFWRLWKSGLLFVQLRYFTHWKVFGHLCDRILIKSFPSVQTSEAFLRWYLETCIRNTWRKLFFIFVIGFKLFILLLIIIKQKRRRNNSYKYWTAPMTLQQSDMVTPHSPPWFLFRQRSQSCPHWGHCPSSSCPGQKTWQPFLHRGT